MKSESELQALCEIYFASGKIIFSPIANFRQARNDIFMKSKDTHVRDQLTVRLKKPSCSWGTAVFDKRCASANRYYISLKPKKLKIEVINFPLKR